MTLVKWLPKLAFFLFWPAVALVVWGELSPRGAEAEAQIWDKLLHFIAYFGLSGIIAVALKADRRVVVSTLLIAAFGGVLEILQGFTGRDPSLYDEFANVFGAIVGSAADWVIVRFVQPKFLAAAARN